MLRGKKSVHRFQQGRGSAKPGSPTVRKAAGPTSHPYGDAHLFSIGADHAGHKLPTAASGPRDDRMFERALPWRGNGVTAGCVPRGVRARQLLAATGVLAFVCAALGVLPVTPAAASCVGPQLVIGTDPEAASLGGGESPAPVTVARDGSLQVAGEWFREGCDDTSAAGAGCAGPPASSESSMREVDLVLEQGGSSWTLGTADAAGRGERYAISWQVDLPSEVVAGPAVVSAGGVGIPVEVSG